MKYPRFYNKFLTNKEFRYKVLSEMELHNVFENPYRITYACFRSEMINIEFAFFPSNDIQIRIFKAIQINYGEDLISIGNEENGYINDVDLIPYIKIRR